MLFKPSPYSGPKGYGFTKALQRARQPYRTRNVITGLGLIGFVSAVYAYSILAVKQDDLSDIELPSVTLPENAPPS
jgi:cytochrome c oxidase assembly factor 3